MTGGFPVSDLFTPAINGQFVVSSQVASFDDATSRN